MAHWVSSRSALEVPAFCATSIGIWIEEFLMQSEDKQREQGGLEFGPGNWCEELLGGEQLSAVGRADTFAGYGEEVASEVLAKAQEWVSSSSVIIVTFGKGRNSNHEPEVTAGSGVIVQLGGGIYGLLTAAHVLSQGENRKDRAEVTLFARPRNWPHAGGIEPINLPPRSCTGVGFGNNKEKGPDLAIFPLASEETDKARGTGNGCLQSRQAAMDRRGQSKAS